MSALQTIPNEGVKLAIFLDSFAKNVQKKDANTIAQINVLIERMLNSSISAATFANDVHALMNTEFPQKLIDFIQRAQPKLRRLLAHHYGIQRPMRESVHAATTAAMSATAMIAENEDELVMVEDLPSSPPPPPPPQSPSSQPPPPSQSWSSQPSPPAPPPPSQSQPPPSSSPLSQTHPQKLVLRAPATKSTSEQSTMASAPSSTTTTMKVDASCEAPPESLPSTFLNGEAIWSRLGDAVPSCERVDSEVVAKISEHVEDRLRALILQLADIAAHRLEPLRLNPLYKQLNDPRKQLRFIEEVEKKAKVLPATLEQEALVKLTKAKDKNKSEKAKEIRRANQEEVLNREANQAAIAALGGSRGTKRAWNASDSQKSAGVNTAAPRPQIRRVNVRDLQCALNCQSSADTALLRFRLAYGLLPSAYSSSLCE